MGHRKQYSERLSARERSQLDGIDGMRAWETYDWTLAAAFLMLALAWSTGYAGAVAARARGSIRCRLL